MCPAGTLRGGDARDENTVEDDGELRRYFERVCRRRRARFSAVQSTAQLRGFDLRPVAPHPRLGAAVHHARHVAFLLAGVHGYAGQRAAGHEQEKEQS